MDQKEGGVMLLWTAFRLLPSLAQIGIVVGLVASLLAAYGLWHHKVYTSGYDAAIYKIATKDKAALNAADKISSQVGDCFNSGGEWDTVGGVCNRR